MYFFSQSMPVPAADSLNLYSLAFDDFSLNDDEMLMAAVSMFLELGLVKTFNIEKEVSAYWVKYVFDKSHNTGFVLKWLLEVYSTEQLLLLEFLYYCSVYLVDNS